MRPISFIYRNILKKALFAICILLSLQISQVSAQIDTEFWFAVPELSHRNTTGGTPGTLRIATLELAATVLIEMPANPAFTPITVDIAANSAAAVDLTYLLDLPGANVNRNLLENKPLNSTGVNNFGLRITATSLVSVYWEVNFTGGSDLWVLKGSNALGTLFYTPFQKEGPNRDISYAVSNTPRPYSAIDIVATKPNTLVTFKLPPNVAASYGTAPITNIIGTAAGSTFTITLQRGQTFSLFPQGFNQTIAGRLAGTKIEATDSIAVSIKDDVLDIGNANDIVGDQLVPVSVIGSQYVMASFGNRNKVYVVATVPNTRVELRNPAGGLMSFVDLALEGQQATIDLPTGTPFYRIASTNGSKFYALHVGDENSARGGAVLPSIGSCTGNTQVTFTRARSDNKFYLFLLVEKGNEDKFLVDGLPPNNTIIDPGGFVEIAGTGGWMAYKSNSINSNTWSVGQHRISNTGGVFHMGILNGFPGQGQLYYGYYSDYGNLNAGAFAGGSQAASTVIRACYGSPVNLYAFGGTTYQWGGPIQYLDDPTIQNPVASNLPPGVYSFWVDIDSDCGHVRVEITVLVSSEIVAFFQSDVSSGCSPLSSVNITDRSINAFEWQFNLGNGTPVIRYDLNPLTPYPPPPAPFPFDAFVINTSYVNTTDEPIEYFATLLAKNEDGCSDFYSKTITVNPSITASFQQFLPIDGDCDNPFEVTFQNESFSNVNPLACATFSDPSLVNFYVWDFGDGEGYVSNDCNETVIHTYLNTSSSPQNYDVSLVAISPFGCRDTVFNTVRVTSAFEPEFLIDKPNGCVDATLGGMEFVISNLSSGDITFANWSIDPPIMGLTFPVVGTSETIVLPNNSNDLIVYTITLQVENIDGCQKQISRTVEVYPRVIPNFTLPASVCNGELVTFTDATTPTTNPLSTYSWSFGDGAGSALQAPTHIYYNVATSPAGNYIPTTYDVQLKVTNPWGCKDSITHTIEVASFILADFTLFPGEGCSPLEVSFSNNSLGNNTDSFLWEFGNGDPNSSLASPPTVTYINTGVAPQTFTARFTRTNAHGCSLFLERDIVVYPEVNIDVVVPISGLTICDSTNVDFSATLAAALPNMHYSWSFGDGSSALGSNASNLYRNVTDAEVQYNVTVVATSEYSCTDVHSLDINVSPHIIALFTANKYEICSGETVVFNYMKMNSIQSYSFLFEFDDGSPDIIFNPDPLIDIDFSRVFVNTSNTLLTVTVTLTVSNGNGTCDKVLTRRIIVNPEVTSDFYAEIAGVLLPDGNPFCSPEVVNFFSSISNATSYHWQFGNLGSSFEANPTFEFINTGNAPIDVVVTLTAFSVLGCQAVTSKTYTIEPEVKAIFDLDNAAGCVPFNADVSALDDPTVTYTWYLDGVFYSNNRQESLSILENKTGVNIDIGITLVATRGLCSKTNSSQVIHVYPEAEAKWSGTPFAEQCSPGVISLTNESNLYDITKPVNNIIWEVFDPANVLVQSSLNQTFNPTTLVNFSNTLQKDFTVRLTSTTIDGCVYSIDSIFTVNPNPKALFNVNFLQNCTPMLIEVQNQSVTIAAPDDYTWTWDGGSATHMGGESYQVEYQNNHPTDDDPKWIVLDLENQYGCTDSYDYLFTVLPQVNASFALALGSVDKICGSESITFDNNSFGGSLTYHWNFGDGNTRVTNGTESVVHTYVNSSNLPTPYVVTLTAENAILCSNQASIPVTIYPRVIAAQSFEIIDVCDGVTIDLTNASTNAAIGGSVFRWDFITADAGGVNHTVNSPTDNLLGVRLQNNSLTDPVTYTVDFSASTTWNFGTPDEHTCAHTATGNNITVYPLLNPIYAPPAPACSGLNGVELDFLKDPASSGGYENDVSFIWDFGDGNTLLAGFTNVSHKYVNLDAVDFVGPVSVFATQKATGCTTSFQLDVRVHPRVESMFTYTFDSICTPYNVVFDNASINGTEFFWDFGHLGRTLTTNNKLPFIQEFDNLTDNDVLEYTISMVATDLATGCSHDTTRQITVNPRVRAIFDVDFDQGCNPLTVQFDNLSTGSSLFNWSFGDGKTANTFEPTNIYSHINRESLEQYTARLVTSNQHGCKSAVERVITVYPLVEADFSIGEVQGCTPLTISLNNATVSGAYLYEWSFGDGQTSSLDQPISVTIVNNTMPLDIFSPNIVLTTKYVGDETCMATHSEQVTVYPHVFPSFDAVLEGCHPLTVNFSNTSLAYGGTFNDKNRYTWTFGNGVNSNFANHSQTYLNPSLVDNIVYTGELKLVSEHGCNDSIDFNVEVFPKPQSRMEIVGDYMACSPFDVEIQNLSVGKGKGTTLQFDYDFGDGDNLSIFSDANVFHQFRNPDSDIKPFMITLTTTTSDGCEDESFQIIHVFPEVTATFAFDPGNAACNPFTVQLQNNSLNSWTQVWNFDDGFNSYLNSPTHRFVNNTINDRVFNVQLTSISEWDCEDTFTLPLTVYAAPVANFAINPPFKVYPDATFEFINQTSPAADTWNYTWTYGDGYGSNLKNPNPHTYETWGDKDDNFRYLVTLLVANPNCSSTISHYLSLIPALPIANFDANDYEACAPLEVYFENNSLYGDTYEWDFGDGNTSTEREPSHTFTEPGYYNVSLTVTGDGGVRHYFRVFQVFENPEADFVIAPREVMLPDARVHMYSKSKRAIQYIWDLGDGSIRTTRDVVHTYTEMGEYRVTLTVFSEYGCEDTKSEYPAVWVKGGGRIRFPNAFVPSKLGPNGGLYDEVDFKNEVFHPVTEAVVEYRLLIFNRWGEQIFQSDDIKIGWDGYYNGKLCSQDVYVWRAIGKYSNGKTFDLRGNVSLLR